MKCHVGIIIRVTWRNALSSVFRVANNPDVGVDTRNSSCIPIGGLGLVVEFSAVRQ